MAQVSTLRRQRDFERLFQSGKRYYDNILTTVVRRRPESDQARVAFIVGKRVDKRAVVRNRIKRRLREAWRRQVPELPISADVAFVAQSASVDASFWELTAVMKAHLAQAGLLQESGSSSVAESSD